MDNIKIMDNNKPIINKMDNNNNNKNSNNNSNNSIYYKYNESTKLKEEYECCICFLACENPIIEPKCQQMFCSDCLKSSLEKSNNICPYCNIETSLSSLMLPPKFVTNYLNELKVTCTLCDEDGLKPMNRKDFKNHLEVECKIKCPGPCGQQILRKDLATHICPFVDLSYLTNVGNKVLSKSGRWLNTPQVINSLLESTNSPAVAHLLKNQQEKQQTLIWAKEETKPITQFNYKGIDVFVFNAAHDTDEIPPVCESVAFAPCNRSMFYLSSHLYSTCKNLFLLDGFESEVLALDIPSHIETLHVYNIKNPLTPSSIPPTVKSIHIHDGYSHPIEGIIPKGVEEVHVYNTVHPVTNNTLPSSVLKVSFNDGYSHPIRPGVIENSVLTIHIGNIKEPLVPNSIPFQSKVAPSRKLFIHSGYKHSFRAGVIPLVESLFIGDTQKPILAESLPNGIKHIHFAEDYAHFVHAASIPLEHLKTLHISNLERLYLPEFSNLQFNDSSVLHYTSNPTKYRFNNIKASLVSKSSHFTI